MADILTRLEDEMEALYDKKKEEISRAQSVIDWPDYMFRAGFLDAFREIGRMLKKIRNPIAPDDTGEIPSILEELNDPGP